jgi:type VI secretion system secreted protein Hcp
MALNALLKISNAPGESRMPDHVGWIEIQGWDWEVNADTSWTKGGGASVGKPDPGKLNFEHYFDTSSTNILRNIFSGRSFDLIELHMMKSTGKAGAGALGKSTQQVFFRMEMVDAFITKVTNSASDEGNVVQKVELVFKEVKFFYRQQKDDGGLKEELNVGWDIPAGKVK